MNKENFEIDTKIAPNDSQRCGKHSAIMIQTPLCMDTPRAVDRDYNYFLIAGQIYKVRGARKGNTGFGGIFTSKMQGAGENEKGGSTERPY